MAYQNRIVDILCTQRKRPSIFEVYIISIFQVDVADCEFLFVIGVTRPSWCHTNSQRDAVVIEEIVISTNLQIGRVCLLQIAIGILVFVIIACKKLLAVIQRGTLSGV